MLQGATSSRSRSSSGSARPSHRRESPQDRTARTFRPGSQSSRRSGRSMFTRILQARAEPLLRSHPGGSPKTRSAGTFPPAWDRTRQNCWCMPTPVGVDGWIPVLVPTQVGARPAVPLARSCPRGDRPRDPPERFHANQGQEEIRQAQVHPNRACPRRTAWSFLIAIRGRPPVLRVESHQDAGVITDSARPFSHE